MALVEDSCENIWNEYERGYSSLQQAQKQNSQVFLDGSKYLWANREDTVDFVASLGSLGISLKVGYSVGSAVLAGSNVPLVVVGGAIWGVVWAGRSVYRAFDALFLE